MARPRAVVGLSRVPTEHVLRTRQKNLFMCCGVDLLLNPTLPAAEGVTRCLSCGAEIRVTLAAGVATQVSPADAVAFVSETREPDGRVEVCCSDSAIFDSVTCLRVWVKARGDPRGIVSAVEEYAARALAATLPHRTSESPPTRG